LGPNLPCIGDIPHGSRYVGNRSLVIRYVLIDFGILRRITAMNYPKLRTSTFTGAMLVFAASSVFAQFSTNDEE